MAKKRTQDAREDCQEDRTGSVRSVAVSLSADRLGMSKMPMLGRSPLGRYSSRSSVAGGVRAADRAGGQAAAPIVTNSHGGDDRPSDGIGEAPIVQRISADYFSTMKIPLR